MPSIPVFLSNITELQVCVRVFQLASWYLINRLAMIYWKARIGQYISYIVKPRYIFHSKYNLILKYYSMLKNNLNTVVLQNMQ